MAQAIRFACDRCGRDIRAWSDGNPYYIDEAGEKRYAYHPDHDALDRCVGNDTPHLCLACGVECMVDSRAPLSNCPECETGELVETYELAGRRCPECKTGKFVKDPDFYAIS